ncbi:MAG: hypothetical protein LBE51_13635 [Acidovorax sp.]|nr:hypothetical protein [Comamonas sp.]MDR2326430.1 hypothetical protein [Acidovorax sp.]
MKTEYRALVEAEICAEGKLHALAGRKSEVERELAEVNEAAAYQGRVLQEARQQMARIEQGAFG